MNHHLKQLTIEERYFLAGVIESSAWIRNHRNTYGIIYKELNLKIKDNKIASWIAKIILTKLRTYDGIKNSIHLNQKESIELIKALKPYFFSDRLLKDIKK